MHIISNTLILEDFNSGVDKSNWQIVDDVVMGGKSNGNMIISGDGTAIFNGYVSLENNGGFSMVKYQFQSTEINKYTKVVITLKGDGNRYQFRLKENSGDKHAYVSYFETTGKWQSIILSLNSFYPAYRGIKLNISNFRSTELSEIAFLIGNKKAEDFRLEIDSILLR